MMVEWHIQNWFHIIVPASLFFSFFIIGLWVRKKLPGYLEALSANSGWKGWHIISQTISEPIFHWSLIFGVYMAIQFINLPSQTKLMVGRVVLALFIISITWTSITLSERLLNIYRERLKFTPLFSPYVITNTLKIVIGVTGALFLLSVLGISITPLIFFLGAGFVAVILIFREELQNVFSGLDVARTRSIRTGDYIKLESGEEGYVTQIMLRKTEIKSPTGMILIVPNSKFCRSTVTIYRKSLKKAEQPFRFYTRLYLKELTGLRAKNLSELVNILKEAPESVIYYHTHRFVEEHHYLTPQPPNDFALWIGDVLGNEVLAERLSSIDTFEFSTIGELRERIIAVLNEELSTHGNGRDAPPGREFHFIKSVSVIMPTPYVAHDLREFVECLKKISVHSLYFHIFESRLRLHKLVNDFSIWIEDSLKEKELAEKIAYLDPYSYTLEGLRSVIIKIIEPYIA